MHLGPASKPVQDNFGQIKVLKGFKLPGWVLPAIIAIPMVASANGGGSQNLDTEIAREAFAVGDYVLMQNELDKLYRDWGRDTLRLRYADALLLQSQAAESLGDQAESLEYLKRYSSLKDTIFDSHNRFAFGVFVIMILLLALIAHIISAQETMLKKNESLSKLLSETMAYKEKESAEQERDEPSTGWPDIQEMNPEELYLFLSKAITRDKLFLNPNFGRQTLMDDYSLSKERIGKAFSAYGTSLPQFINTCRLEYACSLMKRERAMSVTDVASASGFTTRESFSRSFKQQYALTPTEYKENFETSD